MAVPVALVDHPEPSPIVTVGAEPYPAPPLVTNTDTVPVAKVIKDEMAVAFAVAPPPVIVMLGGEVYPAPALVRVIVLT